MKLENLEKANALAKLIEQTQSGYDNLLRWKERSTKLSIGGKYKVDNVYNLCVSEHNDGSGNCAELKRYYGNEALLDVIIAEVGRQLEEFKKEFEAM